MGTKNNPGEFDCYAAAEPDEPMFVLLARDPIAPALVQIWRSIRARMDNSHVIALVEEARAALAKSGKPTLGIGSGKSLEASTCAEAMEKWYADHAEALEWARRKVLEASPGLGETVRDTLAKMLLREVMAARLFSSVASRSGKDCFG